MAPPVSPAPFTTTGVYNQTAIGIVVDYDDPEERGRVRIRLMNQNNIPKDRLPWVAPKGHIGGQIGGSGYTSHQLLLNQFVSVEIDPSTNQPTFVSHGIESPSGEQKGAQQADKDKGPGWPTQARTKSSQDNMKAPAYRTSDQDGHIVESKDDGKFDPNDSNRPKFKLDSKQMREQALKMSNGLGKFIDHPTSGPQKQLQDAIKHIKQFDPQNLSGSIKPALDMMENLLKKGGSGSGNPFQAMSSMVGGGPFQQLMQIVSSLRPQNNNQQPQQQNPGGPKVGDPCFITNSDNSISNGHYFVIAGEFICRKDESGG